MLRNGHREAPEEPTHHGWLRVAEPGEYKLELFLAAFGRWDIKAVRIITRSAEAAQVFGQVGEQ
jgi:hypothetical protein